MSQSAVPVQVRPSGGEEMLTLPIFAGISEADARLVRESATTEEVAAGTILMIEDDPHPDAFYALLGGEVALTCDERMIGLQSAPANLGLLSLLDDQKRTATITAFSDIRVGRLSLSVFRQLMHRSGRFARNVLDTLTRDLRQQHDREAQLIARFDDMFDSPNAKLVRGPWEMPETELHAFTIVGPSSAILRILPEGLRPFGTGLGPWLLCFLIHPKAFSSKQQRENDDRPIHYREALPLVPVHMPDGGLGLFCPEAYPDSYLAIFVGRELYGMPRRIGDIRRTPKSFDLGVNQRLVLRASWKSSYGIDRDECADAIRSGLQAASPEVDTEEREELEQVVGQFRAWLDEGGTRTIPILVRNQVPDVVTSDGQLLRIDELRRVDVALTNPRGFRRLSGPSLRRFDSDWLLAGRCTGGLRLMLDAKMNSCVQLQDYLAPQS